MESVVQFASRASDCGKPCGGPGYRRERPSHHFDDVGGLLTAVAEHAFRDLTECLAAAARAPKRADRLKRITISYVEFAVCAPARFNLMWRTATGSDNHDYHKAADRAFAVLNKAVSGSEELVQIPSAALAQSSAIWSLIHGSLGHA